MTNLTKIIISAAAQIVILVALSSNASAADANFGASMRLIDSLLSVSQEQELEFGEAYAGKNSVIKIKASSANAAVFSATGKPGAKVTVSIVEKKITMITGDGSTAAQQIEVKRFQTGGSLKKSGHAKFAADGTLKNMRVGGQAKISANNVAGDYTGTATLRVVYK